jgi:hypothetical protein
VDLDVIPDITMRGQDDPHGRALTSRTTTVGQLAARVGELAGRPADWWHLVLLDPAGLRQVPLTGPDGIRLWLTTWPPGHRADLHGHGVTEVSTVIAGELTEITIAPEGVTERPLRANRVRVHAGGHTHELHNPGPAFAITLHAHPTP